MGEHSKSSSSSSRHHKHKRSHHRHDEDRESRRHKKHRSERDDVDDDDDEWVEKATSSASAAVSAVSGKPIDTYGTFTPGVPQSGSTLAGAATRMTAESSLTDGFGEGDVGGSSRGNTLFGSAGADEEGDIFSSMGVERKRKEPVAKPDPSDTMGQSSRELNKAHWQGVPDPTPAAVQAQKPAAATPTAGSSGSSWRMAKLRRVYETAQDEGRSVEEVALERYGTMEAFEEALEEKRILGERDDRRKSRSGRETPNATSEGRRFVFTDSNAPLSGPGSRPASRNSFRRPGEGFERSASSSSLRDDGSRPSTPGPKVFTPPPPARVPSKTGPSNLSQATVLAPDPTTTNDSGLGHDKPVLSQSDLNKLQAQALKAKMLGKPNADALEQEYERERRRAEEGGAMQGSTRAAGKEVHVLPTLDGRGRLYDLGTGGAEEDQPKTGRKAKKEKAFESHDPKTGEVLRHAADDDTTTLEELVRQERYSAGRADQKNMDAELAGRIMTDGKFENDLEYVDDNAERLARRKMKSDTLKRAFAIQDYAKTKKALDNCTMCFGDEGESPRAAVVALGTRTYLGLLEFEELCPGHCRIVPIQHHFSSLDADEETWDEIKNFMKTLMQKAAEEDKGVIFFESCINLKNQRHTCIEAVPLPYDLFDQMPGYFGHAIDVSEQEWSQHKKRIIFSDKRPFRRSLVSNLPYFMVQWDYRGEKGYGHVIEGVDDGPEYDQDGYEQKGEIGEKGGGEFPRWFAQEIIGETMGLEPRRWRRPKRHDFAQNAKRVAEFRKTYDRFDWTKMLQQK